MNILYTLNELTSNDASGRIRLLNNVINNQEKIEPLLTYHKVDSFNKIYDEVLFYNGRKLVFSGTFEDGEIVNLWGRNGLIWEKPFR